MRVELGLRDEEVELPALTLCFPCFLLLPALVEELLVDFPLGLALALLVPFEVHEHLAHDAPRLDADIFRSLGMLRVVLFSLTGGGPAEPAVKDGARGDTLLMSFDDFGNGRAGNGRPDLALEVDVRLSRFEKRSG